MHEMVVGLGTGSTANAFIEALGKRVGQGLKMVGVPTSQASFTLAQSLGIPLAELDKVSHVDLTIDGADAIDPEKRLIKGLGGALFREKIIALSSRQVVILAEEHKLKASFDGATLPLEIIPFAWPLIQQMLKRKGFFQFSLRLKDKTPFLTDNHNFIVDLVLSPFAESVESLDHFLKQLPGVVETGFFLHLATYIAIGKNSGDIDVIS